MVQMPEMLLHCSQRFQSMARMQLSPVDYEHNCNNDHEKDKHKASCKAPLQSQPLPPAEGKPPARRRTVAARQPGPVAPTELALLLPCSAASIVRGTPSLLGAKGGSASDSSLAC